MCNVMTVTVTVTALEVAQADRTAEQWEAAPVSPVAGQLGKVHAAWSSGASWLPASPVDCITPRVLPAAGVLLNLCVQEQHQAELRMGGKTRAHL